MKLKVVVLTMLSLMVTGSAFGQDKGTGVGIILGEPTGLSLKLWQTPDTAFDFGLAWSFSDNDKTAIHLHGDWLIHNWELLPDKLSITTGRVPLFYGIGGRLSLNGDTQFGVRFVIGAAYIPDSLPVDFFIEVAPILDLVPNTEIDGNAGVGVRFWF